MLHRPEDVTEYHLLRIPDLVALLAALEFHRLAVRVQRERTGAVC